MATLYVVATPIGNLEDMTLRALRVLKEVDVVVAEDTRRTRKLLAHYQINKTILPLHERSSLREEEKIVALLATSTIAYVVDSGTPGISDPGASFVAKVLATYGNDAKVIPIPGASAMSTLVSVADAPMRHFVFLGFLPKKKGKQTMLKEIAASSYPVMFFESPHRIIKTLKELRSLGEFSLIVGRELTKTFETIYRGGSEEVIERLEKEGVRGEFTVLAFNKGKTQSAKGKTTMQNLKFFNRF